MARRKKQNEDDASKENQENPEHSDNINNDASDDTFGLPEVDYQPIQRDEPLEEMPPSEPIDEPAAAPVDEPVEQPSYEEPAYTQPEAPADEPSSAFETHEEVRPPETAYEEHHPAEEHHEYHSRYAYMEENDQPVWPKVLAIILLILLAGSAIYYFAFYRPQQQQAEQMERDRDREERERILRAERDRQAELKRLQDEAAQRKADSLANLPKEGSIERLSGRTGQYWVVVASAIDDDLLMDFAQKLSKNGRRVRIIPPFGKDGKFHRLAIESRDNYADAQATADGMKGGEFGDQLWVVRY
jgi:hypothetical protein